MAMPILTESIGARCVLPGAAARRRSEWAVPLAVLLPLVFLAVPFHDRLKQVWDAAAPLPEYVAAVGFLAAMAWLGAVKGRRVAAFASPAIALAGVMAISAIVNGVPLVTLATGLREALPWIVPGLLVAQIRDRVAIERILWGMALLATALALYGIASFLTYRAMGGPFHLPPAPRNAWEAWFAYPYYSADYRPGWRLASTFLHDNYFGVWLAMLVPVTWALRTQACALAVRRAAAAMGVIQLVALTWTYSRSAALALAAGVAVLAWRGTPRALGLLLPVLLAAPWFAFRGDVERFVEPGASLGGRVEFAQGALAAVARNPLLGAGPGSVALTDGHYVRVAHQTGLLGLMAWGWLLLAAIAPAARLREAGPWARQTGAALAAGLVACAAGALGGEVWKRPQLAVTCWLLAGLLAAVAARPLPEANR